MLKFCAPDFQPFHSSTDNKIVIMTCDNKDSLTSDERRDLKRKLDVQDSHGDTVQILNIPDVPEKCIKTSTNEDSKTTTTDSCLVAFNQENTTNAYNKTFKKATKHSRRRKKKLEIETEFKTLQSLIPKIANKPSINEVGV